MSVARPPASRSAARWVIDLLGDEGRAVDGASTEIAARDAMYAFALRSCRGAVGPARLEYFASAAEAYRLADGVLRAQEAGRAEGSLSVLDFGCGHGRVGRFLTARPDTRLRAVEADADAVAFVRERLGIDAVVGPHDPAGWTLEAEETTTFSTILAFSVLSHLPAPRFHAWLRRWLELLRPGGLLVFSVLGEGTLLPGRTMPASGHHFETMSESEVLETTEYGTAWVSERFVVDALTEALSRRRRRPRWRRLARGLWQLQDVWIVAVDDQGEAALDRLDLPSLETPSGRLERVEPTADGGLRLEGWAVAGRGGDPARLEAAIETWTDPGAAEGTATETHEAVATSPRADVAKLLDLGDACAPLGVHLELPPPIDPQASLRVLIRHPTTGVAHPLWLGAVESAQLFADLRRAADERDAARDALAVVEASGFGRARRRWMALKERVGL